MKRHIALLLIVACGSVLSVACGGSAANGPVQSSPPPPTFAGFVGTYNCRGCTGQLTLNADSTYALTLDPWPIAVGTAGHYPGSALGSGRWWAGGGDATASRPELVYLCPAFDAVSSGPHCSGSLPNGDAASAWSGLGWEVNGVVYVVLGTNGCSSFYAVGCKNTANYPVYSFQQ